MRLRGPAAAAIEPRADIELKGPPMGPRGPPLMERGGSDMAAPGGRAADGAPIVSGGIGCPVLPASFAICCKIFCTFSGGNSGEQTPCFLSL